MNPDQTYQPPISDTSAAKATAKTSGSLNVLSKFIKAKETDDPETLIDIKITNPLKRLYELISEIKKHQSTTFSLKFTIPLIALPIFLFVAFRLGMGQSVCKQTFASKTGTLKLLSADVPQKDPNRIPVVSRFFELLPFSVKTPTKYAQEQRAILLDANDETTTILNTENIDLTGFDNAKVIVTGNYSSCSQTISLVSKKNVVKR